MKKRLGGKRRGRKMREETGKRAGGRDGRSKDAALCFLRRAALAFRAGHFCLEE